MTNKNYDNQTTGGIVAANFAAASVFQRHGIDFCCHGSTPFTEACRARGLDPEAVAHELDNAADDAPAAVKDFASWPLDLLVDYVLKIHHRNIRTVGPQIEKLLDKVTSVHGAHHPELAEIRHLFRQSLDDLENHLGKEEQVLFPYIYELCQAEAEHREAESFHCGTILYPIGVMESEHSAEGERFVTIAGLTSDFTAPDDACDSYRLLMSRLRAFRDALHEHIHIENNIIFPRALETERRVVANG